MGFDQYIYEALCEHTKALSVALNYRDIFTRVHSDRVMGLSKELGLACQLSEAEMHGVLVASMFHDIGKIGIPDAILLKPANLDEAEWAVMKEHPVIGEKIVLATELEGADIAADLIRHHHENYDGTGYPDNLAGEDIQIGARIIAVADAYDAIAMRRVYHEPRNHTKVMDIMHEEVGKKFDPALLTTFCSIIETSRLKVPSA